MFESNRMEHRVELESARNRRLIMFRTSLTKVMHNNSDNTALYVDLDLFSAFVIVDNKPRFMRTNLKGYLVKVLE